MFVDASAAAPTSQHTKRLAKSFRQALRVVRKVKRSRCLQIGLETRLPGWKTLWTSSEWASAARSGAKSFVRARETEERAYGVRPEDPTGKRDFGAAGDGGRGFRPPPGCASGRRRGR